MLGSSKPTAALSSGLLARKGHARPAMRPQGFHAASVSLDDLGWDDMGDDPSPVVAITPDCAPIAPARPSVPSVLTERTMLREEIQSLDAAPTQVPAAVVTQISHEVCAAKAKAAFTLRLDPARHLRLRLASASRNRSAQALVVDALDAFLATLPEVEGLVSQLSTGPASKGNDP